MSWGLLQPLAKQALRGLVQGETRRSPSKRCDIFMFQKDAGRPTNQEWRCQEKMWSENRTHVTNSGIRTVFWMFWMVFVAKYVAEKTCGTVSRNDSDAKNDLEFSVQSVAPWRQNCFWFLLFFRLTIRYSNMAMGNLHLLFIVDFPIKPSIYEAIRSVMNLILMKWGHGVRPCWKAPLAKINFPITI